MSDTRLSLVDRLEECPCVGATLDKLLQPAILTVLARAELHGYRIAEQVAQMPLFHGQKPDVSGVYRILRSMEARGLVEANWDVSERGPARRLYTLTPDGQECLSRWTVTLASYQEAIGRLLVMAKGASREAGEQCACGRKGRE